MTPGLDVRSKGILAAWIASDIVWAILFIDARKRHERKLSA